MPEDNARLRQLYQADQKDRERPYDSPEAVKGLRGRDAARKAVVLELIRLDELVTPLDRYHAAVILLHGGEPQDFLCAHRLACLSAMAGHRPARWLSAATLDRFLMAVGLAQVYGTQFEYDQASGYYQLRLPLDDSRLLASEKAFLDVPAIIERLTKLNAARK
ncbi:MAG: hypothetical protein KGO96_06060 [Elusimicrobia bacterium]|nr:hypothetical protein [Elusimicrobiota bacterium]MDE2236591.1 hypothetical protein [Elusimicrobiota bacterium]MDE2425453.1 hypothetical protein [Elusimicrobiota bacterium]